MAWVTPISAQQPVPAGITEPVVLEPFVGSEVLCNFPSGLKDTLVFAQDNEREFMEGVGFGLAEAAADRGLAYSNMLAQDDPARMIEQIDKLASPGAVVVAPVDPRSLALSLQSLIAAGTYVGAVVPPPAVTILNAPPIPDGPNTG